MARNWCFTLNNYTDSEIDKILKTDHYNYIIFGKEVGDEGTIHLQGYIQFKKQMQLVSIKKISVFERAHLEKARGTPKPNIDYCSKDVDVTENGFICEQGKKKIDLVKAMYQVKDGVDTEELIEEPGSDFFFNEDCFNV